MSYRAGLSEQESWRVLRSAVQRLIAFQQGKQGIPTIDTLCTNTKPVLQVNGAPERIRTSDPQIRSLGETPETKGISCKPCEIRPVSNQVVTSALQTTKRAQIAYRMQRAADLAHAIAAAEPEDARPLMTAALIDLHAGLPPSEALDKDTAQEWAKRAGEAELVAIAEAVATELQTRNLHPEQRRGLLKWLYLSLPIANRLRFLKWAKESEQ